MAMPTTGTTQPRVFTDEQMQEIMKQEAAQNTTATNATIEQPRQPRTMSDTEMQALVAQDGNAGQPPAMFTMERASANAKQIWNAANKTWGFINRPIVDYAEGVGVQPDAGDVATPIMRTKLADSPFAFMSEASEPVVRAFYGGLSGAWNNGVLPLTSPLSIGLLGGGSLLKGRASAILSGGFAGMMGLDFVKTMPELRDAIDSKDPARIAETITAAVLTGTFAREAGRHAVKSWGAANEVAGTKAFYKGLDATKAKYQAEHPNYNADAAAEIKWRNDVFVNLKELETALYKEPSALSDVDKAERTAFIEESLGKAEQLRQSRTGYNKLVEDYRQQEAANVQDYMDNARPLLLESLAPEEMSYLDRQIAQTVVGKELLYKRLMEEQETGVTKQKVVDTLQAVATKLEGEVKQVEGIAAAEATPMPDKRAAFSATPLDIEPKLKTWAEGLLTPSETSDLRSRVLTDLGRAEERMGNIAEAVTPESRASAKLITTNLETAFKETAKGIYEALGGGRVGIVPYSEYNYIKAREHFVKAWDAYKGAGKSFTEFARMYIDKFGDAIAPYLHRFEKEINPAAPEYKKVGTQLRNETKTQAEPTRVLPERSKYDANDLTNAIYTIRSAESAERGTPFTEPNVHELNAKRRHVMDWIEGKPIDEKRVAEIEKVAAIMDAEAVPEKIAAATKPSELPPMDDDIVISQRYTEEGRPAPGITLGDYKALMRMKEYNPGKVGAQIENPIYQLESIGLKDAMYTPVKEAEYRATVKVKDTVDSFNTKMKMLGLGEPLLERAGKYMLNKANAHMDRIGLYAIAQRGESGIATLRAMKKEVPKLTDAELEMYNWMRGKYENIFADINNARLKSGKKAIGYVEDYFTFNRLFDELDSKYMNIVEMPAKMFNSVIRPGMTVFAHEKTATGGIRQLDYNAERVFKNYVKRSMNHIEIGPVVAKNRELLRPLRDSDKQVVFNMADTHKNAYNTINEWLNYLSGVRPRSQETTPFVDKLLDTVSNNLIRSTLSFNVRSAGIQPTALMNSYAVTGTTHTIQGVYDMASHNKNALKSKVLLGRSFDIGIERAMLATNSKNKAAQGVMRSADTALTFIHKLADVGLTPLKLLDQYTAEAAWHSGYRYALKELKLTDAKAAQFADELVVKSQGSAARSDISKIQRSALGRAAGLYQTFVINNWNFINKDVAGIGRTQSKAETFRRVTQYLIASTLVDIVFEDILGLRSPVGSPVRAFLEEVKKGSNPTRVATRAATELLEYTPVVGGGLRWGTSPLGAVATFADEISMYGADKPGVKSTALELTRKGLGVPRVPKPISNLVESQTQPQRRR